MCFGRALALALAFNFSSAIACSEWPAGAHFLGLVEQQWHWFVARNSQVGLQRISLDDEPRSPTLTPDLSRVAFIDTGGNVAETDLTTGQRQTVLSPSGKAAYAQPEYSTDGRALYLVELKQGISVDTDILKLSYASGELVPEVTQQSAQFEPTVAGDWLYYGSVHCVLGCGRIIQEIWRRHRVSGVAEQVTLLNAISRQPVVDLNRTMYFSSNVTGSYRIYQQRAGSLVAEPLNQEPGIQESPALDANGNIWFVQRTAAGSNIVCQSADGEIKTMPLPAGVSAVRDLEIRQ